MLYPALSVAKHIVTYCNNQNKPISNLKLQKLLYFVWIEYYKKHRSELFLDEIYAWQFGPVVPNVYYEFCPYAGLAIRKEFEEECRQGDIVDIDNAIEKYIDIPTSELVEMTHTQGKPWDVIYNGGSGSRCMIPFALIVRLECGENA